MHFKYSLILSTTYITFMFGIALPMLFPIAVVTFIFLYVVERICITYLYTKPPVYDDALIAMTLGMMKWAPLFGLFFGYWFMGQPQVFHNAAPTRNYSNDREPTGHKVIPQLGPEMPLFICAFMFLAVLIFSKPFVACLKKLDLMKEIKEKEVDENLGSIFEATPSFYRKNLCAEGAYNEQKLKINHGFRESAEKNRTT